MHRSDSSKITGGSPATDSDWCIGASLTYIDVSAWTRLADVDAYARGRGISRQEAIQELVNVGLTGLESSTLDWPRLEAWCRTLHEREGTNYYLEQALVAVLLAGRDCAIAPAADYVTLPRRPEALDCHAVMHHYVAESKRWYFQTNWRRALTTPA